MNIAVIADFFVEEIMGGAEAYTEELMQQLTQRGHNVAKIKSAAVSEEMLKALKDSHVFVVSNFVQLSERTKSFLASDCRYVITEHDHKYLLDRNPANYPDFVAPHHAIINKFLYAKAKAVFCQSKMHADIVRKNLKLDNIVNLGGSLWSKQFFDIIREIKEKKIEKTRKCGIMADANPSKGLQKSAEYCMRNSISYEFVPRCAPKQFLEELAKTETLVFFPATPETFCRVLAEAKLLGCKIITNNLIGAASEDYFRQLNADELLEHLEQMQSKIVDRIEEGLK